LLLLLFDYLVTACLSAVLQGFEFYVAVVIVHALGF